MTDVLFVYDHPDTLAQLSDEEQQAAYRDYKALGAIPGLSGHRLGQPDSTTTLRIRHGARELTSEPFTEALEIAAHSGPVRSRLRGA